MIESSLGFVIHSRPYRETSLIVYLFCEHEGRVSVVARGARSPKSPLKSILQPFRLLELGYRGRGALKTLTHAEPCGMPLKLAGTRLYSGFYLNELLYLLLRDGSPFPQLFATYRQLLSTLVDIPRVEVALRHFELSLLESLGSAISFVRTADSEQPIVPRVVTDITMSWVLSLVIHMRDLIPYFPESSC